MNFRDLEDKTGEFVVCEDGSSRHETERGVYSRRRSLIPADISWSSWPVVRTSTGEPAEMRVKDQDAVDAVRVEIARRWAEMMTSYVTYGR